MLAGQANRADRALAEAIAGLKLAPLLLPGALTALYAAAAGLVSLAVYKAFA